jgi:hypothetical protein
MTPPCNSPSSPPGCPRSALPAYAAAHEHCPGGKHRPLAADHRSGDLIPCSGQCRRAEGRGEPMGLVNMIDDATNRVLSGSYEGETVEAHLDLLGRWPRRYGRPLALWRDHGLWQPPCPPFWPCVPVWAKACTEPQPGTTSLPVHTNLVPRPFGLESPRGTASTTKGCSHAHLPPRRTASARRRAAFAIRTV